MIPDCFPGLEDNMFTGPIHRDVGLRVVFQGHALRVEVCPLSPAPVSAQPPKPRRATQSSRTSNWGKAYQQMKDVPLWQAIEADG